jgi:hypothetical protein
MVGQISTGTHNILNALEGKMAYFVWLLKNVDLIKFIPYVLVF